MALETGWTPRQIAAMQLDTPEVWTEVEEIVAARWQSRAEAAERLGR